MAKLKQDIHISSEEVQDIMSKIPGRVLRYGLSGIFLLVIIGIFISWFVEYPEIIKGKMIITTTVEPVKIVSQSSGLIKQLFVKDGDVVKEGTVLSEIENPLPASSVSYLEAYLTRLEKALARKDVELPIPDTSLYTLGELQIIVNGLVKELLAFNMELNLKMDDVEIRSINSNIENQKELIAVSNKIIAITKKDVEDAKIKFEADEKLYAESFISKMDFFQSESNYRAKELALEHLNQNRIDQKNALIALELQSKKSEFNKLNRIKNNLDAIRGFIKSIKGFVYGWQQKYNLIAIKPGKVSFLQRLQVGNFLKGGEELFAISEPGGMFLGVATVPTSGYGKVKVGQRVNILLESFPYYEYGMLRGIVKGVALFPNTSEYRVEISMPDGMMSTRKQLLKFSPEMIGNAEIITDDKRVLLRLFESIDKAIKRK
jgi:multidrug efflux pump subunit AcrA (membrane-fusion protein)